jgi:hypothetical protein
VHNAVGPAVTFEHVLDTAARVAGFAGEVARADGDTLARLDVQEFMGPRSLPLWLRDPDWQAFMDRSGASAAAAGLAPRPLEDTVADSLAWEQTLGTARKRSRAGLDRVDELAMIESLAAQGLSIPD